MNDTPTPVPTTPPSQPVQVYANRGGEQIFMFSADGAAQGRPMMSSDLDAVIDGLRALNVLQAKMAKFVRALAAAEDVDDAVLKARLEG